MSSIAVFSPGFTATMLTAAMALALLVIFVMLWVRRKPVRGPLAALLATLVLIAALLIADQWRFRVAGLREAFVLADDWILAWPILAAAIWWVAARR